MCVNSWILKTPKEAHNEGKYSKLELKDEGYCWTDHAKYNEQIEDSGSSRSEFINDKPDKEASEDLSKTKTYHSKHTHFELVLIIIPTNSCLHHLNQITWEVSNTDTCPCELRGHVEESTIEEQSPHWHHDVTELEFWNISLYTTYIIVIINLDRQSLIGFEPLWSLGHSWSLCQRFLTLELQHMLNNRSL